jgi:hypothetical protein
MPAEPAPEGVFLSGPFTAGAHLARHLCKRAFARAGVTVREKHGGIKERSVDLIAASELVVACVGQAPPAITDAYGRSLPELELRLAATQLRRKGLAVLVGPEPSPPADPQDELAAVVELRQWLRRHLGAEAIFDLPEFDAQDDQSGAVRGRLWALAFDHALADATDSPLPDDFEALAAAVLGDASRKVARRGKGRRVLHRRVEKAELSLPPPEWFDGLVERFLAWAADGARRARPILNDRVFLSYSRKDRLVALRVRAALERAGHPVWMDESQARPGERLATTIFPGLERCGGMVVLMTPNSAASSWVPREAAAGLRLREQWGKESFFVLPLRSADLAAEAFDGVHAEVEAEDPLLSEILQATLELEAADLDERLDRVFAHIAELRGDPRPR